jgi:hypothetical protein
MKYAIALTLVLLLLVELALANPTTQSINRFEDPINESVPIEVNPWFGETLDITYHCEIRGDEESPPTVNWYLLKGKMEIDSSDQASPTSKCDIDWTLEPGDYYLSTYRTDNIRYEQSIEFHQLDPISTQLRFFCVIAGLMLWWRNSDKTKMKA